MRDTNSAVQSNPSSKFKSLYLAAALTLVASDAYAVDYFDAKVTGIGIAAGETRIRFTIDKDPNAIFLTDSFGGDELKRLVGLLLSAYAAQSPVFMIRSSETASAGVLHYTNVVFVSVGARTWD
jgi:hypothetical protein